MTKIIDETLKHTKERLIKYFKKIVEIIKQPEMTILPGQIAFSMLLSIVPIITLLVVVASLFGVTMNDIVQMFNKIVPGGAGSIVPYLIGDSVDLRLAILFVWLFYLATGGATSIIVVSNQIYGIEQSTFAKRRFKAIFMTIYIILIFLFVLLVPIFGSKILELLSFTGIHRELSNVYNVLKGPLTWIILFLFLRSLYEIAPDRRRKTSHINAGALFTTIGWLIVLNIYKYLALNINNYNVFYGTLSNIAFVMIWLYFMSFIFVIGLSLNYGEEVEAEAKAPKAIIRARKKKEKSKE